MKFQKNFPNTIKENSDWYNVWLKLNGLSQFLLMLIRIRDMKEERSVSECLDK